jgi:hypothetical protein
MSTSRFARADHRGRRLNCYLSIFTIFWLCVPISIGVGVESYNFWRLERDSAYSPGVVDAIELPGLRGERPTVAWGPFHGVELNGVPADAKVGDRVTVRYLPHDPHIAVEVGLGVQGWQFPPVIMVFLDLLGILQVHVLFRRLDLDVFGADRYKMRTWWRERRVNSR